MSQKAVERIFNNFDNLIDGFVDFPDTVKAEEDFWKYMGIAGIIGNARYSNPEAQIDNYFSLCGFMREKQGFIYGFQYAVSLMI